MDSVGWQRNLIGTYSQMEYGIFKWFTFLELRIQVRVERQLDADHGWEVAGTFDAPGSEWVRSVR